MFIAHCANDARSERGHLRAFRIKKKDGGEAGIRSGTFHNSLLDNALLKEPFWLQVVMFHSLSSDIIAGHS